MEIGRAVNIFGGASLRATGDARYPFVVGLIFMWSVATAMSYVFGIVMGLGIIGMWTAFLLDENIQVPSYWYEDGQAKNGKSKGFIRDGKPFKSRYEPSDFSKTGVKVS